MTSTSKTSKDRSLESSTAEKAARRVRRARNVGRHARRSRIAELEHLLAYQVVQENPGLALDSPKTKRMARELVVELRKRYDRLDAWDDKYAPALYTPKGSRAREVIVHSLLCIPQVAYIKATLEKKAPNGKGALGGAQIPVATFLFIALAQASANVAETFRSFQGNAKRSWGLHYPRLGAGYRSLLKTMRARLRREDPELVKHALVDLAREATEELQANGEPTVSHAMRYLAIDGFLVKSNVQQHKGIDDHETQRLRGKRRNIGWVIYTSTRSFRQEQAGDSAGGDDAPWRGDTGHHPTPDDSVGESGRRRREAEKKVFQIRKKCHGNKVVSLHCVRLNQPVIADVFAAEVNEREAVLCLLDDLFLLWPDAPVHALVGDSLFDAETFCHQLVFDWGIQPVFVRGQEYSAENAWVAHSNDEERRGVNGVPCCEHGLMRFKRKSDFWDADKRAAAGIPRGEPAPTDAARIRWCCPVGECPEEVTYPRDNARLHTLYPQLNLDDLMEMEDVLFAADLRRWEGVYDDAIAAGLEPPERPGRPTPRRTHGEYPVARLLLSASANAIESSWSLLAGGFEGNHGPLRAAWVKEDRDMEWLLLTAVLGVAARRTAYRTGLYDRSEQEATALGLTEIATAEAPAPGPTAAQVAAVAASRPIVARKPRTWHGDDVS